MNMSMAYNLMDFLEVKSAGNASFSPNEKKVAYLSDNPGTSQVFLASVEGGDVEQLTDFADSVSFVRFSPTENVLIFGKAKGGNEQMQFYLLDLDTRQITDITAKPDVRHTFGAWSRDGKSICFASNERNGKDFDVYVMDIETLETRCVLEGKGWYSAEGFSPQGTYLVARQNHSNASTDLYLCALKTGEIEHITPHEGDIDYGGAGWLPDESAFFFMQDKEGEFKGLARYSLTEKKSEYVLAPEWDVDGFAITRDGTRIIVNINEEGYNRAVVYEVETFKELSYHFPAGNIYQARFSGSGSRLVFNVASSKNTLDVWLLDLETGKSRQLTHSHQGVPAEVMVEPELVRFTSFDGLSVPAFIYRPKETNAGEKMPVIINIHGGPEEQSRPNFAPLTQYLVHNGYAVVTPNIRGSSGYGKSYMALDNVEKRLDSVKDIIALRDYIASTPDMDADRIALYGASYGGFMVLACMAFYPKLWAAGVDIVGIANFVTFLENTASYRRALREAEYGSLANHRDILEEISPIHSIENIEAPLLLLHGANDPRVPLSEAEQVVARLKEVGKHAELLVYPDEGHGIFKLKNKLDAYPKMVRFLDSALKQG